MLIHDRFKFHLNELRADLKEKFGLTNIMDIPNEDIIEKIQKIFNDNELDNNSD